MTRIFTSLAVLNAIGLLASFILGSVSKWHGSILDADDPTFLIHFCVGLATAMLTLLVHCLIFTYFLGTGRWVKEVTLAYQLPDEPWHKLTRELKRKTFPPALIAMLVTIATSAAGAGTQLQEWSWLIHGSLAIIALAVNGWAFLVEYRNVTANAAVIEAVLDEVDRIRAERGLPSNAEELAKQE